MSNNKILVLGSNGMLGKMISLYLDSFKDLDITLTSRNSTEFIEKNFGGKYLKFDAICDNINSIINNDDRFVLHELKLDGIAFALNYGLNLVETKYVARMDADDISDLTRFEKQINFLENNPKHVMVGCFVKIIDENSQETVQKFKFFKGNSIFK